MADRSETVKLMTRDDLEREVLRLDGMLDAERKMNRELMARSGMVERECLFCQETFKAGIGTGRRLDAEYCCSQHQQKAKTLRRSRGAKEIALPSAEFYRGQGV